MQKFTFCPQDNPLYILMLHPYMLDRQFQKGIQDFDVIRLDRGILKGIYNRIHTNDMHEYTFKDKNSGCITLNYNKALIVENITPYDGWDTIFYTKATKDRYLVITRDQLYVVKKGENDYLLSTEFLFSSSNFDFVVSHLSDERYDSYNVLTTKDFGIIASISKMRKFEPKIYYNQIRDITLGIHGFKFKQWKDETKLFDTISYTNNSIFFDSNHYQMLLSTNEEESTLYTAYLSTEYQKTYTLNIPLTNFHTTTEPKLIRLLISFQEGNNIDPSSFWEEMGLKYIGDDDNFILIRERGRTSVFYAYRQLNNHFIYEVCDNNTIDEMGIDSIFDKLFVQLRSI